MNATKTIKTRKGDRTLKPHDGGEAFVCRDCGSLIDPVGGHYPEWTQEEADNAVCPLCGSTDTAYSFAD